jgi:hypothetical protein
MKFSTVGLMGPLAVAAALSAAPRLAAQEPPQVPPPTPIEQALIERVCSTALDAAHDQCISAKLTALRADFGRDLGRLSVAERRSLDEACLEVRTLEGRDAYIGCLDGQLAKIKARMTKARPAAAAPAATVAASFVPESAPESAPAEQGVSLLTIIGGTAAGVLVAGGIAFVALRSRRGQPAPVACTRCGAEMSEYGSLCTTCRREAAEEARRASAGRANQERAQDDIGRREREEAELREQPARLEEAERLRQQELAQQRAEEEERLRQEREEELRRQAAAAVVVEEPTGPWALLGVTKDAGPDEIYAAYQELKAKYDPDVVSHLGFDAQEHFKTKAQAIDAAYQQLMAALTSVA